MAGVVQWTIDELWSGLQQIENGFNSVASELNADKAQLTKLWSATKADTNAARRAANQALLTPQIHQNSVLRLSYLAPIKAKYNQAVALAQSALKSAGYTAPNLSGMGFAIAIAPATAVALVVAALALLATLVLLTQSQRNNTATIARLIGDPATTPAQKAALLKALKDANKSLPPPLDLGLSWLPWAIGGVLAIMVLPSVLPRRTA